MTAFHRIGDVGGQVAATAIQCWATYYRADYGAALRRAWEAVSLARDAADPHATSWVLNVVGAIRMKPQPESSTQEVLAGLIERVTFHNAENGFCVLRAKARGHRDLVTVVGHAATISAGEWITATGDWVNDRTDGQQFKARFLRTSVPTSVDGIEKYLPPA